MITPDTHSIHTPDSVCLFGILTCVCVLRRRSRVKTSRYPLTPRVSIRTHARTCETNKQTGLNHIVRIKMIIHIPII